MIRKFCSYNHRLVIFLSVIGFLETATAFLQKGNNFVAIGSRSHIYNRDDLAPPMAPIMYSMVNGFHYKDSESNRVVRKELERQDWIDRSILYYSKVMREERRRNLGQTTDFDSPEQQEEYVILAKKHYFAIRKVKDKKFHQAELIYRRIIDELINDEDQCDHAKLAVTTLLLALLTKKMGDPKKTRSVFLSFFRIAVLNREPGTECACSAKVLGAYALFEMQQGNSIKSVEIAKTALEFDRSLAPILQWKQFQDALDRNDRMHHGEDSAMAF